MKELADLVRPNILKMEAYRSARDEFEGQAKIYLDANENPFQKSYNRYPSSDHAELRTAIAEMKELKIEEIVLGNGSDELIDLVLRAFAEPGRDRVASISPSYGMYKVLAELNDLEYRTVALNKDFDLGPEQVAAFLEMENLKVIFLCSPNNPSGNCLSGQFVEQLVQEFKGIVVIDEAYIDFAESPSWLTKFRSYPNLIILQTFSKALGAAGLRLGILFTQPFFAELIRQIKPPYNLGTCSQQEALKILKDKPWQSEILVLREERERLSAFLRSKSWVSKVYPSEANFILFQSPKAAELYRFLKSRGIIIRERSSQVKDSLRVSVGTPEEMAILYQNLNQFS